MLAVVLLCSRADKGRWYEKQVERQGHKLFLCSSHKRLRKVLQRASDACIMVLVVIAVWEPEDKAYWNQALATINKVYDVTYINL